MAEVTFSDPGRPQRICDGCGQTDDHPRLVYGEGDRDLLFHYDCTPHYVRDQHPSPAYAAAEKGVRGDKLVAVVAKHADEEGAA